MEQKRYWLRGGLILGLPSLVLMLLMILTANRNSATIIDLNLVQSPFSKLLPYSILDSVPILIIAGSVGWFIVGSVLGWIYGKIKNKSGVVRQ